MHETIVTIACVMVVALIFFIQKYVEYRRTLEFHQRIAWCTSNNHHIRSNLSLLDWIQHVEVYSRNKSKWSREFPRTQSMIPVDIKYSINSDKEREIAKKIIQEYQTQLLANYINGKLVFFFNSSKVTNGEFFLISLKEFLENPRHKNIPHKIYGETTDYGIVYHKMLYLTQAYYCAMQKDPQNKDSLAYLSLEATKESLDTGEFME